MFVVEEGAAQVQQGQQEISGQGQAGFGGKHEARGLLRMGAAWAGA